MQQKEKGYFSNLLKNMFSIFDIQANPENLAGISEIVIFESLTSLLFYNWFLPQAYPGLQQIVLTHFISLPFLSAIPISSFASRVTLEDYLREKLNLKEALMLSAQGIPSVLLSQYLVGAVFAGGFYVPKISFQSLLVVAGSKMITRPLLQLLYSMFLGKVPNTIKKFDRNLMKQSESQFAQVLRWFTKDKKNEQIGGQILQMAQTM